MRMPHLPVRSAVQAHRLNRIVLLVSFLIVPYGLACAQSVTLSWDANTETSLAGYKVYTGTTSRAYGAPETVGKVTTFVKSSLAPGTYYFAVTAYDTSGIESGYSNEVTAIVGSSADNTPPAISDITTTGATTTGVTVAWSTNETSDTQVEYGTSASYGSLSALNSAMVTAHTQSLGGLAADTIYYYRVRSRDAEGNLALSVGSSFRTASATSPATLTVSLSTPPAGATLSGVVTATATATTGIAGVQFLINGSLLGVEDTTAPYAVLWSTASFADGIYTLAARAKDTTGNTAVSAGVPVIIRNTSPATGPRAALPFSEGKGLMSSDVSGNGNTAVLADATWTAGRFGNALSFNGSTSYVRAGANNLPAPNAQQTLCVYYFVSSNPSSTRVMLRTGNTTEHKDLMVGFRKSRLGVWNSANVWLVSATMPATNVWHHIAYLFNGRTHSLYVDGVLSATSTVSPGTKPTTGFEVGRGPGGTGYFRGKLDEVMIYDRALSSNEINSLRTSSSSPGTLQDAATESAAAAPDSADHEEGARAKWRGRRNAQAEPTPAVRFELSKASFSSEEPLELTQFTVTNPGSSDKPVELKTWLASSAMPPTTLGTTGEEGSYVLPAGTVSEFGPVKVLDSSDMPHGDVYEVGSRMIEPVTGDLVSEKVSSFAVSSGMGAAEPGGLEHAAAPGITVDAEMSVPAYSEGDIISVSDLAVRNTADREVSVQLKVWLEARGIEPVPLMRVGADGSLLVPAGAELHFYRPRDLAVTASLPRGDYALRCRVLDPATGQILAERSVYFRVQ